MTRHHATLSLLRWFDYEHLPEGKIRDTSAMVAVLARNMVNSLPDGPELSAGLRKLLEAKDCFVRSRIESLDNESGN